MRYACRVRNRRGGLVSLGAGILGAIAAAMIAASGAVAANQATLGDTSGTPTANICAAGFNCTYMPFNSSYIENQVYPELRVPSDGTVTSFSVNAGSAGGKVELRVLRPAGGGTDFRSMEFTGAGTSPPETLSTGVNTFNVSLPVKAGDVLGLDNTSSALMFDISNTNYHQPYITAYYQPPSADGTPGLPDGTTAAPNNNRIYPRLLLSATVQFTPPEVANATQSRRRWREGNKLPKISRTPRHPVGTTFAFSLNEPARVTFAFTQRLPGRRVKGRCVAPNRRNLHKPRCTRIVVRGRLAFTGHAGNNKVFFDGRITRLKRLKPGRYTVVIKATNTVGQQSAPAFLTFTIVR